MEMKIGSAEEFVEEFLQYRFWHPTKSRKKPKPLIKPKRPGPKPKCAAGPEELRRMYVDEGKMAKEIAAMYGMSESGVRGMLKRYGIRREKKGD